MNVPMRWGKGATRHVTGLKNGGRRANRTPLLGVIGVKRVDRKTETMRRLKPGKRVTLGDGVVYVVEPSGSLRREAPKHTKHTRRAA